MSAWNAYLDANTGNTYYANSVTGVVTWDIPDDYRNYLASAPVPPPSDAPPAFETVDSVAADPAPPALPDPPFQPPAPDNWVKHIDSSTGNPYYHNTSSGETRWDVPPGFVEESPPPPFPIGVEMRAPEGTPEPETPEPGQLHESDSAVLPPPAMSPSVEFDALSRTQPLPTISSSGWERFLDTKSMKYYYAHRATGRVQWDDPETDLAAVNETAMAPPLSPPPVNREQAVARARAKFEAAAVEPPAPAPLAPAPRPSVHGRTKSHHFLMEVQQAQEPGAKSAGPAPRKLDMSVLNPALARMHLGAPRSGVLSDGHSPPGSGNLSDNSPNLAQGHASRSASVIAASQATLSVIAGKPVGAVEHKVPIPLFSNSGPLARGKASSISLSRTFPGAPPPSSEVHKLPAPLRTDIANFQIAGFAERHFRELKTRRGLSKQKVPTEQLIRFQKEPISQCLLTTAKDHNTPSVDNFRRVMQAMGDLPGGKPPGHYAREIVHVAQKKAYLRDEILCQVCKQVTDNPVNASLVRGWKLMAVLVSAFAPTVAFEEFLLTFIAKNFQGPREVAILAPFCFWRLEKTLKSGAEATAYSMEQLDGWLDKGVPSTMVLFGGSIDYIMSLQRAEGHVEPVPVLLLRLVKIIKDGGGLTTKGMFRLAGDRGETIALREQIESKHSYEFKCPSIHVAGDLLKIWLRDLSEPLIPHKYYDECLAIGTDKKRALEFCHRSLPQSHYEVLDFLMKFLQEITSHEKDNSMSAENLAIVFCTNMLRRRHAEEDPAAMLKNSQREKAFVKTLIESWVSK